jgi:hypothetical protein
VLSQKHQAQWWNWLSWRLPQERMTQSYLCCRGYVYYSYSEIAAQINASQSSSNRLISKSTIHRRLREWRLHAQISAKKPLLKETNKKNRLAWAKKQEQWKLSYGLLSLHFWFQPPCLCEMQRRCTDDLRMFSACVVPRYDGVGVHFCWQCQWYI